MGGKFSFDQPVEITSDDADALTVEGGIRSGGVRITDASGALQVPWASMPQNTVGQPELAANSVGSGELRTAMFNQAGSAPFTPPGNGYAFFPTATAGDRYSQLEVDTPSTNRWRWVDISNSDHANVSSTWRYMGRA